MMSNSKPDGASAVQIVGTKVQVQWKKVNELAKDNKKKVIWVGLRGDVTAGIVMFWAFVALLSAQFIYVM